MTDELPPEAGDDNDRLEEIADLPEAANPEFTGRVVRAIERRRLANHGLEFGWRAPLLLLREFLTMVWQLTIRNPGPRRTRDEWRHQ